MITNRYVKPRLLLAAIAWFFLCSIASSAKSEQWVRHELSRDFYSEGGTCADIDKDGQVDLIAGPFVYYGPDFQTKSTLYEPKPYSINGYSNNFLAYAHDINGDSWDDLIVFDFPGVQTWYLQNPGKDVRNVSAWPKHVALEATDNESPMLKDITGDGKPEIICCNGGSFGYAIAGDDPTKPWPFIPVSEKGNFQRFTHGIGVGDVNDDGRLDMMAAHGWWENPGNLSSDASSKPWPFHEFRFAGTSAQMYAADFDGDQQNEIVSSHQAHGYGLNMFDKVKNNSDGSWSFNTQSIMTDKEGSSPTGLAISQLHAVEVADINNDGTPDIVTGKRFWAHQGHDPGENEPAYLVWFEAVKAPGNSVRFMPHVIDEDSGVGTQITVYDVNKDGKLDVFSASKRGVHLFIQTDDHDPKGNAKLAEAQSKLFKTSAQSFVKIDDTIGGYRPADESGALNLDFETGTLRDWRGHGGAFFKQPVKGDMVSSRRNDMKSNHQGNFWIGSFEICLDVAQGTLESRPFKLTKPWASFLIGGGSTDKSVVQLIDLSTGEVISSTSATDNETMKRAVVDLAKFQGKDVFIRLVDTGTEGWGHINFDDFRLHDAQPKIAAADRLMKLDVLQHKSLPPEQVAGAMTLPKGFNIQVIANEPEVQQPVAMTIDEKGRIWVVETYEYPIRAEGDKGRDRILIFEDTNQDGTLDSRKVFYEGLNLASGIEVGFGGVFVGAAPYLYFIPDANRDDVPDSEPIVELDGWAYQDTHEMLNSFIWGPDGWLYGCHGVFTHSKVGRPGTPDAQRQPINAGIWRYHPQKKHFEVFAHGTSNPWGVDFDSHGQCFLTACVIPHLYHVIQGARYQRQAGQHFDPFTFDDIKTIALHRHWIGDNPHGGNNRSDEAGGGHAHSGAMIYLGGSWPQQYHDQIFMNNIHGARLNQDKLTRKGSGYVGDRAPDFLFANDRSSQILYFRYGPDGQVYAIDWYDIQQCHTKNPGDHDRSNGRVYRISYNNTPPVKVDLSSWSDQELVEALTHKNQWYARTARRILQEHSDAPEFKSTASAIRDAMTKSNDPVEQLNYLWTLAACGKVSIQDVEWGLASKDPYIRGWSIQFASEALSPAESAKGESLLVAYSKTPSLTQVDRRYLTSASLKYPVNTAGAILSNIVHSVEDNDDHNLPLLFWYSLSRIGRENPELAGRIASNSAIGILPGYLIRQFSSSDDPLQSNVAVRLLENHADSNNIERLLAEISTGLQTRKAPVMPSEWQRVRDRLLQNKNDNVVRLAWSVAARYRDAEAIERMKKLVVDSAATVAQRLNALQTLREIRDPKVADLARTVMLEPDMRSDALKVLADNLEPTSANELISSMKSWTPEDRRLAIYAMTRRASTADVLWTAIQEKSVGVNEISADMMEQLSQLKGFGGFAAFQERWSAARQSVGQAEKQIAQLKTIVEQRGDKIDLGEGKALFAKTCGQCHQLFGEGGNVGPELTGSNRRDLDYLFSNIVTPSAVMAKEYQPWIVQTDDGRVLTGLLKQRSKESITLQTTTELITLYMEEVDGMKQSEQSMMPENLLATLDQKQIADLVGYLRSK